MIFIRSFQTLLQTTLDKLRLAIIGQSQFGADVYKLLRNANHKVVGVFTIPDIQGRADPLGKAYIFNYETAKHDYSCF